MPILKFFRQLISSHSKPHSHKKELRYDNVEIRNAVDGTVIKGHDAVKDYFKHEKELHEKYGSCIIFQVYRLNLQAKTLEELQGQKISEIKVSGEFVSSNDTVATVKEKLLSLLAKETQFDLSINDSDYISLYFGGHPMPDNKAFYADNFVMLPAWVQVMLHSCAYEELIQLITKLVNRKQEH